MKLLQLVEFPRINIDEIVVKLRLMEISQTFSHSSDIYL